MYKYRTTQYLYYVYKCILNIGSRITTLMMLYLVLCIPNKFILCELISYVVIFFGQFVVLDPIPSPLLISCNFYFYSWIYTNTLKNFKIYERHELVISSIFKTICWSDQQTIEMTVEFEEQ